MTVVIDHSRRSFRWTNMSDLSNQSNGSRRTSIKPDHQLHMIAGMLFYFPSINQLLTHSVGSTTLIFGKVYRQRLTTKF
jgi:hypothetical protein